MSKIEEALRLARNDGVILVKDADNDSHAKPNGEKRQERVSRSHMPVLVRLEPYTDYDLDQRYLASNRVINDDYPDAALTSYKMLRTRLLQSMNANDWRTLAITSPRDGVGKSLTAINLAIAMASQGAREVFLLDLDLRSPGIGQKLGLPGFELDLGEYLAGRTTINRVCCRVGIENLNVLPSSQRQSNSSELLSSDTMHNLLRTILATSSNPIILIDLPAILSADDALAISPWVDGFLMVVSQSESGRDDVSRSLEMLRGTNMMGVVLNKSNEK